MSKSMASIRLGSIATLALCAMLPASSIAPGIPSTRTAAQPPGAVVPEILLLSPTNFQVFQRSSLRRGQILVSGKVPSPCTLLEARVTGRSIQGVLPQRWITLPFKSTDMTFNTSLPISAGGWYRLDFRATIGIRVMARARVENVGVGEVFVGAGQSNSTNYGEEKLVPTTGMVSSFDGSVWREAADPQEGTHDKSTKGSFWPAFGDAMYQRWHVPIGVAVTGQGGSSIYAWKPDSDLFQWMMTRIYKLGRNGFRAVLWHQGETDSEMSASDYADKLTDIIGASTRSAGWQFPWIVAQASYNTPDKAFVPAVRLGQKRLWDTGVAIQGPDSDTLIGDNRADNGIGVHMSGKGLRAHGKLWEESVSAYLRIALK